MMDPVATNPSSELSDAADAVFDKETKFAAYRVRLLTLLYMGRHAGLTQRKQTRNGA